MNPLAWARSGFRMRREFLDALKGGEEVWDTNGDVYTAYKRGWRWAAIPLFAGALSACSMWALGVISAALLAAIGTCIAVARFCGGTCWVSLGGYTVELYGYRVRFADSELGLAARGENRWQLRSNHAGRQPRVA